MSKDPSPRLRTGPGWLRTEPGAASLFLAIATLLKVPLALTPTLPAFVRRLPLRIPFRPIILRELEGPELVEGPFEGLRTGPGWLRTEPGAASLFLAIATLLKVPLALTPTLPAFVRRLPLRIPFRPIILRELEGPFEGLRAGPDTASLSQPPSLPRKRESTPPPFPPSPSTLLTMPLLKLRSALTPTPAPVPHSHIPVRRVPPVRSLRTPVRSPPTPKDPLPSDHPEGTRRT